MRSRASLEHRAAGVARSVMSADAVPGKGERIPQHRAPAQVRVGEGEALAASERAFFEPRFGHDFGTVRVHHDRDASEHAAMLQARAFTIGTDIFFGRGEFRPATTGGRELIAHELAHVLQQRSELAIQRQPAPGALGAPARPTIPPELRQSVNPATMTDDEIAARHDWIMSVLKTFTESTPETAELEAQASRLGVELGRRRALAAGRTFSEDAIRTMRAYFQRNAKTEKDSCIVALNNAMRLVTGEPQLPTTPETIEKTMARIAASGHSSEAHEIWFEAKGGRITKGAARPERLHESVWEAVRTMAGDDPGWSVFTMSLLDGFHSVTLTLDLNIPSSPHVYWSDQWKSKGGWKEYTKAQLDAEVTRLVQGWWDGQAEGKKADTVVRLWRMRSTAAVASTPP